MNKKILTSLLMTPLAFGAMADITVAPNLQKSEGWTQTGITGDTQVFTADGVRCPIEAAQLTRTLENLRPGNYKMVFTNAYNVKATVDGVECVKDENDANVLTFTILGDAKKTVTLIIEADKSGGFGFDALQINLGFNFAAAAADFKSKLPDIPEVSNKNSALLQSADYKEVTDKVKAVKDLIAQLENEETQLEVYDNSWLWKYEAGEDLISTAIKQLTEGTDKDKVNTVITKINQDNKAYELHGLLDIYNGEFDEAIKAIDEKQAYRDKVVEYAEACRVDENKKMQELIDGLTAKIESGMTDDEFTEEYNILVEQLTEFLNLIDGFINDAKAYYDMVVMYSSLEETYTKRFSELIALQGVKGEFEDKTTYDYADDFNALSTEWQDELKGYFTTAATSIAEATGATKGDDDKYVFNGGDAIKGAAGKFAAVKETVDAQYVNMEGRMLESAQLVEGQNAEMLKAITAIHNQEILIPETLPAKLAEEAETLKGQLTALLSAVVDKYATLELPVAEFDAKIAEIAEKVQKFSPIPDLTKAYDDLAKYIDENVNNPENTEVENVINGKFDETLKAIKANMDALVLGDDTNEVAKSIADTKANAEKLVEAQKVAWETLQEYKKPIDIIEQIINELKVFEDVDKEAVKDQVSDFKDFYDTYYKSVEKFNAVTTTESDQESYIILTGLTDELKQVALDEISVAVAMANYVQTIMQLNKAAVEKKYDEVKAEAEKETYFGQDAVAEQLTAIQSELDQIKTVLLESEQDIYGPYAEKANNVYDNLDNILTSLTDLEPDIDAYKANQKWANGQEEALMGLLNPNKFNELYALNEATSWSPAKDYFDKLIQDYLNTLGGLLDPDTENSIQAALEQGIAEGAEDARANVQDQVEKLVADVTGLSDRIKNNHGAYRNLLEIAKTTQNAIQSAQSTLDSNMEKSGLTADAPEVKAWQERIEALLNNGVDPEGKELTGLTELNRQLGDNYGTGVAKDKEMELKAQYDKLVNAAAALETEISAGIGDAVEAANNLYIVNKWIPTYNALRDAYKGTLDAFNAYGSANITNVDYYNYLLEHVVIGDVKVLGNHQPIYDYSSKITELDNTVREYIKKQNEAGVVITLDDYTAETAPAADLTAGMKGLVTDMQTQAVNAATTYFVDVIAKNAQATIAEAKADMIAKGCTEAIAAHYVEPAEQRMDTWGKFLSTEGDVVSQVNFIANESEFIPGDIDKDAAAAATWTEAHNAATTQLDKWAADVENFSSKDAEVEKTFNDAKDAVEAMLNASLDTLKDNLAALEKQLEAAEKAYNTLRATHDADTTTKAFNETIGQLRGDNDALNEYAEGLAGSPADADIAGQIDAIEDAVKNSKDIVADKADIDKLIEEVKADIANGYISLVKSENNKLDQLVAKVFDAYQAALEADKFDEETALAKREALDGLQKRVDDLFTANKDGIEDKDAYKADAQALESELSNELTNLQSMLSGESEDLTNALTALNKKYEAVYNNVKAGQEALEESMKEEFESKYGNLITELEEIATAVDAKGNAVILYQDDFASQIDAVAAKLDELNAAVEAAKKAAEEKAEIEKATAENLEALNAELNEARTALESAKTQVTEWGVDEWNTFLNTLDGRIEAIQGDIDAESAITEENADGITEAEKADLLAEIASLYTEMNYYVEGAAIMYAENARVAANDAISAARKALTEATVFDSKMLHDALDDQDTALETASNKLKTDLAAAKDTEAKVAAYETFAEAAEGIKEAVADIAADIEENTYVLGDIDHSGGEPNAADIMTLIGWIGQGATIDAVKESEGAALAAAVDVNGDGQLNIADATALIKLIKTDAGQRPARIVAARSGEGDAIYALTRTGEEAGSRIYSLSLNNSGEFIGAQVDIKLPAGMNLVDAQMTERASGHEVQVYDNGNGNYRLVIFSMENAAFMGSAGELVNLTIEGIGTPVVEEMVLSTPAHAAVLGHAADTNMIESIIEGAHNMKERIYNAAGQSLRAVQRGINIIRHSDGSTTKELHK